MSCRALPGLEPKAGTLRFQRLDDGSIFLHTWAGDSLAFVRSDQGDDYEHLTVEEARDVVEAVLGLWGLLS